VKTVWIDGKRSEWFRTSGGVRQLCVLFPVMFSRVMDEIIGRVTGQDSGILKSMIYDYENELENRRWEI
jgi:hypothetical protein